MNETTATRRAGHVVVREVLHALSVGDEVARSRAMGHFKAHGGSLDQWHMRPVREAMTNALTHAEDELELLKGSNAATARGALRSVRRRLEWGLWP